MSVSHQAVAHTPNKVTNPNKVTHAQELFFDLAPARGQSANKGSVHKAVFEGLWMATA